MTVIIDTREQRPWVFPEWVDSEVGTLKYGDYAIKGDDRFAIERKSADDFAGTVSTGWERFQREFARMDAANVVAKVIIVEADFETFCFTEKDGHYYNPRHNHVRLTPAFIRKRIAELTFMGISVIFATNAELARGLAISIFAEREKQIASEKENDNNR